MHTAVIRALVGTLHPLSSHVLVRRGVQLLAILRELSYDLLTSVVGEDPLHEQLSERLVHRRS